MSDSFARVIEDSVSPDGIRITTLHLRYWRAIHSEFMTHRLFSRNGRSSRAVPVVTLLQEEPYIPHFMKNKPGMQATEEMLPGDLERARQVWNYMIECCRYGVGELHKLGVHKQWANRPLEWFGFIDVLVTSTDWANFYALRDEAGAQPEMETLAKQIIAAREESTPLLLYPGQWHMPYLHKVWTDGTFDGYRDVVGEEFVRVDLDLALKLSTARCARLSYKPFDGDGSHEKEVERYERLVVSQPVHASPAEHQATPDTFYTVEDERVWMNGHLFGNFRGWIQHRKMLPNEAVFD